jgi:hypothetical protein
MRLEQNTLIIRKGREDARRTEKVKIWTGRGGL